MFGEILWSLFLLLGSGYLYFEATQLRQMQEYSAVGPDFWPKLLLSLLIILSGYRLIKCFFLWKKQRSGETLSDPNIQRTSPHEWFRVGYATLLVVLYIYLLKILGFLVASPLFIIAMMLFINPQKKKIIPIGVVGIMIIIYFLFIKFLYIPLPKGNGIFYEISNFLRF